MAVPDTHGGVPVVAPVLAEPLPVANPLHVTTESVQGARRGGGGGLGTRGLGRRLGDRPLGSQAQNEHRSNDRGPHPKADGRNTACKGAK